ncbi:MULTISPECIES: heavy metal sensor histidine kinase [Hydrogenophaga]|uniref:Sensor protein n=1 Tax=Hydrogenophaga intermedia TaxID=65786 RepID=A0A1L1PKC7_HYDIT|nr:MULTISPECIES: heavy metal sensor histidine kinase [Hydrogenophaga]TMU77912.1 two-component sensor histidine kinase [Hydrogenophaga intermedia]CDN85755.1 Heavy metal sensor signal transduction histidine kinase [Hydrogenophaga intermedia]
MNTTTMAPPTSSATAELHAEPTPCTYSIGKRLSLLLAVQTIIGLGVLLAVIYAATWMLFESRQQEELRGYSNVLIEVLKESDAHGGEAEMTQKLLWLSERRPGNFVQINRADGSTFYRDPLPTFDPYTAPSSELRFDIPRADGSAPLQGRLLIDCSRDAQYGQRMALLLVAATLAGGAFVAWATFWRVRCSLRPLADLAARTRAIDVRRLDQRLALSEPIEELQPLIEQFNGLMHRVERTYVQLEGFNADVAHELRTPLANLIGHTEVALSRERSAPELEEVLLSNLEELQRLAGIVNDMLFLAQADRGVKARRGAAVSLAELVNQVVEFHEAPMEEAGLAIDIEGDVQLAVDEPLFKRALSNLLGNAIRYADKDSRLCVRILREGDNGVRLWVENTGPAIEPEHLPRLFDRFFRADASRCELEKPHHGLGLSIVAAIARMHDGFAAAESEAGRTRVGFSMV